jgi:hypothetical protein
MGYASTSAPEQGRAVLADIDMSALPVCRHSERGRAVLAEYRYVGTPVCRRLLGELYTEWGSVVINTSIDQYIDMSIRNAQYV